MSCRCPRSPCPRATAWRAPPRPRPSACSSTAPRATGADLSLDEDSAATIAAICRRLDGLPLALELAAARARLLTPEVLLARLDEHAPGGGLRDLPDRQRTMTATLDWSHDLLEREEQDLLARLAVFAGSFSLDAIEPVTGVPTTPSRRSRSWSTSHW